MNVICLFVDLFIYLYYNNNTYYYLMAELQLLYNELIIQLKLMKYLIHI